MLPWRPVGDEEVLSMGDEEVFDLVDENGRVIGRATRGACHADPALLHRAVRGLVFDQTIGDAAAGIFHQLQTGNAAILNTLAIDRGHLFACDDFQGHWNVSQGRSAPTNRSSISFQYIA